MSLTFNEWVVTEVTSSIPIPFSFINESDVHLYVDGVELVQGVDYVITTPSTIEATTAPPSGSTVLIKRETDATTKAVDFQSGAMLTESDLDTGFDQVFNLAQETKNEIDFLRTDYNEAEDLFNQLLPFTDEINSVANDLGISAVTTVDYGDLSVDTTTTSNPESDSAILNVFEKLDDINTINGHINTIDLVHDNLESITETAQNLSLLNSVALNTPNISRVALSITDIEAVADVSETGVFQDIVTNLPDIQEAAEAATSATASAATATSAASAAAAVESSVAAAAVTATSAASQTAGNVIAAIEQADLAASASASASASATSASASAAQAQATSDTITSNAAYVDIVAVNAAIAGKADASQVMTNVPPQAVFTDTVYTKPSDEPISYINGLQTALNDKVDDGQVQTDVPSGAVFTDTVYTHPTTAGNKHIPSGGASGNVLTYSSSGTATWSAPAAGGASDIDGLSDGFTNNYNSLSLGSGALNNGTSTASHQVALGVNAMANETYGQDSTAIGFEALHDNTISHQNTAIGSKALRHNQSTGKQNTGVGYRALFSNTTASTNTAVGHDSQLFATTGTNNTSIGASSGKSLTTGAYNVLLGEYAGANITTGGGNTIVGRDGGTSTMSNTLLLSAGSYERLRVDASGMTVNGAPLASGATDIDGLSDGTTQGSGQTGLGNNALRISASGYNNTAVGEAALFSDVNGQNNTAIGHQSMFYSNTNYWNTAVGAKSLWSLQASNNGDNTAVGALSLLGSTTGEKNTAVGYGSQSSATSGTGNTTLGYESGRYLSTGSNNVLLGKDAGKNVGTGNNNTIVGNNVGTSFSDTVLLSAGTTERLKVDASGLSINGSPLAAAEDINGLSDGKTHGTSLSLGVNSQNAVASVGNTSVGNTSMMDASAGTENNVAMGYHAFQFCNGGKRNVVVGSEAASMMQSGSENVGVGYGAMGSSWSAYYSSTNSTAVGCRSMANITSSTNTALGHEALKGGAAGSAASNNVALGAQTLTNILSGTENTAVGRGSGRTLTTGGYNVMLGSGWNPQLTTGNYNTLMGYGASPSSATVSNEITLGMTVNALRCQQTSISSLSDERDKTNIVDSPYGLDFVNSLKPRQFTWQPRDSADQRNGKNQVGFIAQELLVSADGQNELLDLVYDTNPNKLEAKAGNLIPILTQAIKDLSAKVDALEAKLGETT